MERAIMIGITSMSKETMFSDFHNLNIITTTLDKYCLLYTSTNESSEKADK